MTAIAMTHETGTRGNDVAKSLMGRGRVRNTAQFVPEVRAGDLADTVKSATVRETDASQRALADQRTEARITAVLNDVDAIKNRARNVYVSVSDGVVTLYGAVRDSAAARDIEKAIRTNTGLDAVQNNIHTIGAQAGD
jgi:osmotically-inducible protein OsmY